MSKSIREILHTERAAMEEHIRRLKKDGKQGVRYTATISDMKLLIFGLLYDVGWLVHLIAGIVSLSKNGFPYAADRAALLVLIRELSTSAKKTQRIKRCLLRQERQPGNAQSKGRNICRYA